MQKYSIINEEWKNKNNSENLKLKTDLFLKNNYNIYKKIINTIENEIKIYSKTKKKSFFESANWKEYLKRYNQKKYFWLIVSYEIKRRKNKNNIN